MTRRGHRVTDAERVLIVSMYSGESLTMREIAGQIDRSYGLVNRVLHAEDAMVRSRGGYRRLPRTEV